MKQGCIICHIVFFSEMNFQMPAEISEYIKLTAGNFYYIVIQILFFSIFWLPG